MGFFENSITQYRRMWQEESGRTKLAIKNIILSFGLKFVSVLVSLLVVPMTINYLDSTQYGIWLTISSIVAWTTFFDLGLANGFKNHFTQAIAREDVILARQYVSTTYASISVLMIGGICIIMIVNRWINWASLLKIEQTYNPILTKTFIILLTFFCLNMIANVFVKLLEGDQRPAIASLISCIGQIISLLSIFLLTKFSNGSLIKLALYFSSVPFFTMFFASIILFSLSKYKIYRPSLSTIKISLVRNILGLGSKFFIIYLSLLVVFHLGNIVLSREIGPIAVTQYNVANKYLSIVYMVSAIIVNPMWAAFTDAYAKKDFNWMRASIYKLEKWLVIATILCCLACVFSPLFFYIWIGDSVSIPLLLTISVTFFIISQIAANFYTTIICGLGHMYLQTCIYVAAALVAYPGMVYCCRVFGIMGITMIPTVVYLIQSITCRIQLKKIINKTATGIWMK